MQQHEYARFSGVWKKAADRGHVGLCWKHLGFEKRAHGIDCGGGEQTISAAFFCLAEISEVAGHLNPGPAVAKQMELKLNSEPSQDFRRCLRVAIEAATRVVLREDAECVLKGLLKGLISLMRHRRKAHRATYRIVALDHWMECFLLSIRRPVGHDNFHGYQEGCH